MAFNISYVFIAKDRFTAVADKVTRAANKVKRKLKGVETQSTKTGDSFDLLAKRAVALAGFMASLRVFAKPIKEAIDFESALADLGKVMEFDLPTGLQRTAKEIKNLSRELPITQIGLTEIATAGAQLGIVEKDILGFTKTVSKISVAFDLMPGEAGTAVAKLSNIFEIPVTEFESFADSINLVSNNTASAADEIVRSLQNKAAAAGRIMGFTSRETVGLASTFIQLGVNANRVGSIMDSMSRRLTDASIVGEDFAERFAEKPQESLIKLLRAINQLSGAKKAQVLSDVFGEFSGRVGLLAETMDDRLIPTMRLATDVQASAGSVQKEFATRSATTENQLQLLSNRMRNVAINLGVVLLPAVNAIAAAIGFFADGIAKLTEVTGPLIPMIFAAAGAFALVKAVTLAWAVAQSILNIALNANPIGFVVAGIVAAIVAITFIIKKIKDFGGLTNVFKKIGQSIINFVLTPYMAVAKAIDAIAGTDLSGKLQAFVELDALKIEPPAAAAKIVDTLTGSELEAKLSSFVQLDASRIEPPAAAGAQETKTTVDINLNAPAGIIQSTEARTTGPGRTNVGQNMGLAGAT